MCELIVNVLTVWVCRVSVVFWVELLLSRKGGLLVALWGFFGLGGVVWVLGCLGLRGRGLVLGC